MLSNPTIQLIFKMIISGIFVGTITENAKRLPRVGGLVAALPIISLLTIFWLLIDRQSNADIAHFIRGILFGLIPTALFLFLLMWLLERNWQFGVALFVSLIVLAIGWALMRAFAT